MGIVKGPPRSPVSTPPAPGLGGNRKNALPPTAPAVGQGQPARLPESGSEAAGSTPAQGDGLPPEVQGRTNANPTGVTSPGTGAVAPGPVVAEGAAAAGPEALASEKVAAEPSGESSGGTGSAQKPTVVALAAPGPDHEPETVAPVGRVVAVEELLPGVVSDAGEAVGVVGDELGREIQVCRREGLALCAADGSVKERSQAVLLALYAVYLRVLTDPSALERVRSEAALRPNKRTSTEQQVAALAFPGRACQARRADVGDGRDRRAEHALALLYLQSQGVQGKDSVLELLAKQGGVAGCAAHARKARRAANASVVAASATARLVEQPVALVGVPDRVVAAPPAGTPAVLRVEQPVPLDSVPDGVDREPSPLRPGLDARVVSELFDAAARATGHGSVWVEIVLERGRPASVGAVRVGCPPPPAAVVVVPDERALAPVLASAPQQAATPGFIRPSICIRGRPMPGLIGLKVPPSPAATPVPHRAPATTSPQGSTGSGGSAF